SHTVAALCFAGLLYMIKRDLSRLTFVYFYLLVLVGLLGYRVLLRGWYRLRRTQGAGVTRILIVGAGKGGMDVVLQLDRQHWSSCQVVGGLDDDQGKRDTLCASYPVIGCLDDACRVIRAEAIDDVILTLPRHAQERMRNLVVRLRYLPLHIHVVPDY